MRAHSATAKIIESSLSKKKKITIFQRYMNYSSNLFPFGKLESPTKTQDNKGILFSTPSVYCDKRDCHIASNLLMSFIASTVTTQQTSVNSFQCSKLKWTNNYLLKHIMKANNVWGAAL